MSNERTSISPVDVQQFLASHRHHQCWQAQRGHGTFLTFDLGDRIHKIRRDGTEYFTGSYHLWIYLAEWEILAGERVIASWSDEANRIDRALARFATVSLLAIVETTRPPELLVHFTGELRLRLRPLSTEKEAPIESEDESDLLMLFFPDRTVLSYSTQSGFYLTGR